MGRAWSLSVALVVAVSCSSPAAAPTTDPPDWYADRDEVPSCGTFAFEGYDAPEDLGQGTRCLLDAFADDEPAELEITELTDEGDPITSIYRTSGDGGLELLTDWTQDEFRSDTSHTHAECTGLEEGADGRPRTSGCQEVGDMRDP